MKRLLSGLSSFALLAALVGTVGSGEASAKMCHDAKGKFVKCPSSMMGGSMMSGHMMKKQCRDAKGHFMKCHDSMSHMKM